MLGTIDLVNFLSIAKDWVAWVKFLTLLGSVILFFVFGLHRYFLMTYRLYKNLYRKVLFISDSTDFVAEYNLIKNSKIFRVSELKGHDVRILENIDGHRAVIIGYSSTYDLEFIKGLIDRTRQQGAALLVYSNATIPPNIIVELKKYTLHVISNSPLRLIGDLYAIMTTIK